MFRGRSSRSRSTCGGSSAWSPGDDRDLDEHRADQPRLDRGAYRPRLLEMPCVDLVVRLEVAEVGQVHEAGDDVRHRAAVLAEQAVDVPQRLLGLRLDRVADRAALVEAALACEEDEAVGLAGGGEGRVG